MFYFMLNIALYIKIFKTTNLYAYLFTTTNYVVTMVFSMDYVHFTHKNSVLFAIFFNFLLHKRSFSVIISINNLFTVN